MATSSKKPTLKETYGREYKSLQRKLKSLEKRGYYVQGKYGELKSPISLLPKKPKEIRKESLESIRKLSKDVYKKVKFEGKSGVEGRKIERSRAAKKGLVTKAQHEEERRKPHTKPLTEEEEQELFDRAYEQRKQLEEDEAREAEDYFNNIRIADATYNIIDNFLMRLNGWSPPDWWNGKMKSTQDQQIREAIFLLERVRDGLIDANEEDVESMVKRLEENASTINEIIDRLLTDYDPDANATRVTTLGEILQGSTMTLEQNARLNDYYDDYWGDVA